MNFSGNKQLATTLQLVAPILLLFAILIIIVLIGYFNIKADSEGHNFEYTYEIDVSGQTITESKSYCIYFNKDYKAADVESSYINYLAKTGGRVLELQSQKGCKSKSLGNYYFNGNDFKYLAFYP